MNEIEFVGKCVLINKKILVIGDLHLGYEQGLRDRGVGVPLGIFRGIIGELDEIFERIGKDGRGVEKVVLLGDLKHEFGRILRDEWKEILGLIDYLNERCEETFIVKGNHDVFTDIVAKKRNIKIVDYYIEGEFCFLHGDRDFKEVYDKKIKYWVMGHGHPAMVIGEKDGIKKEKYKCFLVGKYKGKEIIIVPSFFPVVEGVDARDGGLGLAWNFNLGKFKVFVVPEDGLEALDFGLLGKL